MSVKEGKWKDACSTVGELVLIYTAHDHQLNRIVIEVMHLSSSPMLEAVVATLDARQKVLGSNPESISRGRHSFYPARRCRLRHQEARHQLFHDSRDF